MKVYRLIKNGAVVGERMTATEIGEKIGIKPKCVSTYATLKSTYKKRWRFEEIVDDKDIHELHRPSKDGRHYDVWVNDVYEGRFTAAEIAKKYGMATSTVYAAASNGKLVRGKIEIVEDVVTDAFAMYFLKQVEVIKKWLNGREMKIVVKGEKHGD